MTQALTIATTPIETKGKLNNDIKKQLIKLIECEFANKESLYHQIQKEEKRKILETYHKKVGFDKLLKEYNNYLVEKENIAKQITLTINKIETLGLDIDGDPKESYHDGKWNTSATELNKMLDAIEKNAPSANLRSKLITRLLLASTLGEANVIMKEILGNGIIPTLKEI